jgi:hypothetical protein
MVDYRAEKQVDVYGPYVPSFGEYKLQSGSRAKHSTPAMTGAQGQDSNDNKYWITQYTDSNSKSPALGCFLENKISYDEFSSNEAEYAGANAYRRDTRLIKHGGPIKMYNAGTSNVEAPQKVAPTLSGFKKHTSGLAVLGKVISHKIMTGERGYIYIDPEEAQV